MPNRYYADMFDAEEKFYVFDRLDGDSACCGPFNHLSSARGCASHLNENDGKPNGERPHQIQHRIDAQLFAIETRHLVIGGKYRARDLPSRSVVRTSTGTEYVRCNNIDSVMRWGQPIPGSGDWMVEYVYRLPKGQELTDREKAEVVEAMAAMEARRG